MYSVFVLDEKSRLKVLEKFPFQFEKGIGHHITYRFPCNKTDEILFSDTIRLVEYVSDDSLECFVAEIDGNNIRPDGRKFHLTWSLNQDRKPFESNLLITNKKIVGEKKNMIIEPISINCTFQILK
jgi:hypothetical protein